METKKRKLPDLTTMIFISLIIGAFAGAALHYLVPEGYVRDTVIINGIFYVVGNGFLRAMQMLVVPLVFCSLVCGSMAIENTKTLRKSGSEDNCLLSFYNGGCYISCTGCCQSH